LRWLTRLVAIAFLLSLLAAIPKVYRERAAMPLILGAAAMRGGPLPMRADCVSAHRSDPSLCVRSPQYVRTVDWLREHFAPGRSPVVYSDQTLDRIALRYYSHLGWGAHRDSSCAVYYSESPEWLAAVLERPRTIVIAANAVLELLEAAVERCREVADADVPPASARRASESIVDRCAGVHPSAADPLRNLGLGGIDFDAERRDDVISLRARFVGVATPIESILITLRDAEGRAVDVFTDHDLSAFSHSSLREIQVASIPGEFVAEACMVDGEGFAVRVVADGLGD